MRRYAVMVSWSKMKTWRGFPRLATTTSTCWGDIRLRCRMPSLVASYEHSGTQMRLKSVGCSITPISGGYPIVPFGRLPDTLRSAEVRERVSRDPRSPRFSTHTILKVKSAMKVPAKSIAGVMTASAVVFVLTHAALARAIETEPVPCTTCAEAIAIEPAIQLPDPAAESVADGEAIPLSPTPQRVVIDPPDSQQQSASAEPVVPPALPSAAVPYGAMIDDAAREYNVPPALVRAMVTTESNFDPQAVSPKGAIGLMQLMPATAKRFGAVDPADPRTNLRTGTRYLRWLLDRFGSDLKLAVAAYNAGEGAVDKYGGQVPPYAETRDYVTKVLNHYRIYSGGGEEVLPTAVNAAQPLLKTSSGPARRVNAEQALQGVSRLMQAALFSNSAS
ncbi:soluble lytic murein transglycosylase-like protein [Paraburkholderia sp. BL8N3]|nr:soluble lytic murein transglycosylase-like protein [Paraburkholderia sp. BL8N3]